MALAASAETVKVAVIDTGYNGDPSHLCKEGHYNYINHKEEIGQDQIGHGTFVATAIKEYAGDKVDYCIVVLKVFGKPGKKLPDGTEESAEYNGGIPDAVQYAAGIGAKVINMSLSGEGNIVREQVALIEAVHKKAVIFVSAGNKYLNLDIKCNTYPACYKIPGVFVVGATDDNGKVMGNNGSIIDENEAWEYQGMIGTSMSTAIATGKFVAGYK